MSNELETLILASLVNREEYKQKVYPNLKPEIFDSETHKTVFKLYSEFFDTYSRPANKDALLVELENKKSLPEDVYTESKTLVEKLYSDQVRASICKQEMPWLLDKSKKYITDRSCFNAIMQSLSILEGKGAMSREAIPDILKEALSISFDTDVGHDYFEDAAARFEYYNKKENKISLSLELLNKITNGGVPKKSLIVPIAPTGVGKTLYLCNEAAHQIMQGKNVLYVSLEMAPERIAERIDANILDIAIQDLKLLPESSFMNKILDQQKKSAGKLIIRQYPPGTFNANHLRFLLKEIKAKKNMVPDIVIVDYLALMASYRSKSVDNSYSYLRFVTEELRGVMVEFDMLGISPNQTNREGQSSTDYDLTQMADSHGISMTADLIFGLISTEELEKLGRLRIKQLKNRFGDLNYYNSFVVGITRSKMRLYDTDMATTESKYEPADHLGLNNKTMKPPAASGLKF